MPGKRAFADDLKQARLAAGLTQVKLAQRLGVDPGAISGWERAVRMPDDQNREAVAGFLGISLADFLVRYEAGDDGARVKTRAAKERLISEEDRELLRRLLRRLEETG